MVALGIALPVVLFVALLALGVPVFAVLGAASIAFLAFSEPLPITLFSHGLFGNLNSFALIAVPLYIFTGDSIIEAGIGDDLLDFIETLVGGLRSGFGSATLLGCGFFATISGSNVADAAAIGRITLDRLRELGYPRNYSAAMIASGASTGVLIPPSISYIIAGTILGISVTELFLAAFIPGFFILFGMIVTNIVLNRRRGHEDGGDGGFAGVGAVASAGWQAKYGLLIPVIILGGIYAGIFTPTEAAAVAIAATLLIGIAINTLSLGSFPAMLERSALVNGIISPNIATGLVLSQVLAGLGLPSQLANAFLGTAQGFYLVVFLMLVFFIVAGALVEITPNIIILGPLFLPIATGIGMDPTHFAIFFISALGVGFITPPIGINLYVLSAISDVPVLEVARKAAPYAVVMFALVLIIGWFPGFFMWVV